MFYTVFERDEYHDPYIWKTLLCETNKRPIEAAVRICPIKYVFLKISQISQKNTCLGVTY